jgi:hypothetical protein
MGDIHQRPPLTLVRCCASGRMGLASLGRLPPEGVGRMGLGAGRASGAQLLHPASFWCDPASRQVLVSASASMTGCRLVRTVRSESRISIRVTNQYFSILSHQLLVSASASSALDEAEGARRTPRDARAARRGPGWSASWLAARALPPLSPPGGLRPGGPGWDRRRRPSQWMTPYAMESVRATGIHVWLAESCCG